VANLLDGVAELTATGQMEALGVLQDAVTTATGLETSFGARHWSSILFENLRLNQ
jgi:hypothetical protein